MDAEYQIFSNIADWLGNNNHVKGIIKVYSEKEICLSCSNVAQQFKTRYPNIVIQMIDGTGKTLIY